MARRETDNPNWGGRRSNTGPKRQYLKIPVERIPVETFIGQGTKIEVFLVGENVLLYHIEGQGLTTIDDLYRGSIDDLLTMLLDPIGLTVDDHRIIQY